MDGDEHAVVVSVSGTEGEDTSSCCAATPAAAVGPPAAGGQACQASSPPPPPSEELRKKSTFPLKSAMPKLRRFISHGLLRLLNERVDLLEGLRCQS